MDVISRTHPDINLDDLHLDEFKDNHLRIFNNIMVFDWLDIEAGLLFHNRKAINPELMREYGMPVEYRSFAPTIGIKLQPWLNGGPLLSLDWERSFKGVNKSNLEYDRWEVDAQWKYHIPGLRLLNMRAGFGLYTTKETDYFLDFTNFRDENLPEGWNDDWSGNFQLLGSRLRLALRRRFLFFREDFRQRRLEATEGLHERRMVRADIFPVFALARVLQLLRFLAEGRRADEPH